MKNAMTKTALNSLITGAALVAALTACTKARQPDINDDETKSQIFAISELQGQQYSIKTGASVSAMDAQNDVHALAEKPQVSIDSSNAPSRLQSIFKTLPVSAQSGQTYAVRMSVDAKFVTLFRIVTNVQDLTDLDKTSMIQQSVLVNKAKQQLNLVPMAQITIKDYGVLCRIKNDSGDTTSNLKICHTDFNQATHIQISLKGDDLQAALGQHTMDQVFLKDRLNGKVSTLSALQQQMKFSVYPVTDDKVVSYVQNDSGSTVNLLIYKVMKKSQITDDRILQQLKSNFQLGQVAQCSKEVLANLSADDQKDCVLTLAYTIKGDAVRAETQTTDDLGRPGIKVDLKNTASSSSRMVKFEEAVPAVVVNPKDITELNPYNTIRISDILNKEFMMRRTFEDAASTTTGFGPGASGNMDLVRFELQDKALVVRRNMVINGSKDSTTIDHEELMSIPVTYKKIDPATSSSVAPRLIDATKEDAQYAFLDWTNNTIKPTNSPLSYASGGPETCFDSTSRQDVTDLDNRIQDGVLSFSISGSYTFTPDCITQYNLQDYGYGDMLQSNFNIKERVSFMVNNGSQDNNSGLSVAFTAQNSLGYGVFTSDRLNPDQYGNRSGLLGSEVPRPIIYDFTNGKQLVYHLGGLPDDQSSWVYKALVDGTKEVVADWNQSLHRAFVGTSLDRKGDFIVLKVDGVDDTVGHLGDLDRSYIWNFTKNMDSGLLGLSQAAPNPRSGRIEQNNVLMYSGNLISELGAIRNMVRKQAAYHEMQKQALAALLTDANPLKGAENTNTPAGDDNAGLDLDNGDAPTKPAGKMILQDRASMRPSLSSQLPSFGAMANNSRRLRSTSVGHTTDRNLKEQKAQLLSKMSAGFSVDHILQQAVDQRLTGDTLALKALVSKELLKSKNLSEEQRRNLVAELRRETLSSAFNKNFMKGPNCISSAEDFEAAAPLDPDLMDDSKTADIFKKWYKATLAHEMGHSLGLTHNFEGSVDKANFLFAGETASSTSRNYSSIMDYVADQYQRYNGPGPYDVRALRVAYTGMIEISPSLKDAIKDDGKGGKILSLNGGTASVALTKASDDFYYEIPMETYRKLALGGQSWFRMDSSVTNRFPVKPYMYCTDKDVGTDPLCYRWDMGTTEQEIVDFYIHQYKDEYATYNTRGDDLMKMRGFSDYVGRHLLSNFLPIRMFLEETFYRAILGGSQQQVTSAAMAALDGYKFFLELASSPTENLSFDNPARFHLYQAKTDSGTENILVETKPMQDRFVPGSDSSLETRGIEFDKGIAVSLLTLQGLGGPRYEAHDITSLSFADLERYFLGFRANQSLIFALQQGVMANATPSFIFGKGGLNVLPIDDYKVDISDQFRSRILLSAAINLEGSSLDDKGNYGALFHVSSSQNNVPKDRFAVTKIDQSLSSGTSVKFWAMDNASMASKLIATATRNRRYIENSDKIGADLLKLFKMAKAKSTAATNAANFVAAKFTGDPNIDFKNSMAANAIRTLDVKTEADFEAQAEQTLADLMALNTDGALVSADDISNMQQAYKQQLGKDLTADQALKLILARTVNETLTYMASLDDTARQIDALDPDKIDATKLKGLEDSIVSTGTQLAQDNGLIGVAQKAMCNDKSQSTSPSADGTTMTMAATQASSVTDLTRADNLETQYGLIVRNLEILNSILFNLHPEMNRY